MKLYLSVRQVLCILWAVLASTSVSCDPPVIDDSLIIKGGKGLRRTLLDEATAPSRLVAIADLHGDYDNAMRTLRLSSLVDEAGAWVGGDTHLVQTGDLMDRGPNSTALLDLFVRLKKEASDVGGQVTCLLGNHELMNLQGDLRYVNKHELVYIGHQMSNAGGRREASPKEVWRELFAPSGLYGSLLREERQVAVVAGEGECRTLFVHAGLTPTALQRSGSLEQLNAHVKQEVAAANPGRGSHLLGEPGPLWHRGLVQGRQSQACPLMKQTLEAVGAVQMVVGHTVQDHGIKTRCSGMLHMIDVGISRAYNGEPAAWECVQGSDGPRALYEGREPINLVKEVPRTHKELRMS